MPTGIWPYLQFVSTVVAGAIAVLGILFEARDKGGRVTRTGRLAVAAAVLTSGIAVVGLWIVQRQKWDDDERVAAERAEERLHYQDLLERSQRVLADVRRGLHPIEQWKMTLRLSAPLGGADPLTKSLRDVDQDIRDLFLAQKATVQHGPPSDEDVGWTIPYDEYYGMLESNKLIKPQWRAYELRDLQPYYQRCDIPIGVRFVELSEAPFSGPRGVSALQVYPLPADMTGEAMLLPRANVLSLQFGPFDLVDFVSGDSVPVRSLFDLAGKAMLISAPGYEVQDVRVEFGTPMYTRAASGALAIPSAAGNVAG